MYINIYIYLKKTNVYIHILYICMNFFIFAKYSTPRSAVRVQLRRMRSDLPHVQL